MPGGPLAGKLATRKSQFWLLTSAEKAVFILMRRKSFGKGDGAGERAGRTYIDSESHRAMIKIIMGPGCK